MKGSTIPEIFLNVCEQLGDTKPAILYKKPGDKQFREMNYNELRDNVECLATGLLELGIRSSDRVGIVSENRLEWILIDLAVTSLGAVDVPIFPTQTASQEEYIFKDASVTAIVVSNNYQLNKVMEFKDRLPELRHVIVMNEEFDTDDVSVKSLNEVIKRGRQLKMPGERRKELAERIKKINPDDLLTIIYTSGTTGNPKGVMLTNRNIMHNVNAAHEILDHDEKDTFLSFLPFCHSYERATGYYCCLMHGATLAIAESLDTVAGNILEIKPTLMTTVPKLLETIRKKIYNNIEKESISKKKIFHWAVDIGKKYSEAREKGKIPFRLKMQRATADRLVYSKIREKTGGKLRFFVSGGAALPFEVAKFFDAVNILVLEGYGLTESSPVISVNRTDDYEIGTVGKPLPDVEVKIANDGEILARGSNIMKGYWNDAEATEKAIDEEGWLYTGDVGRFTEKGNIKITDRKKHIFVSSGGKNIAPQPIENLLQQSRFIEHVVLIGDRREYCTALLTPNYEQLGALADDFGIAYMDTSELINNKKIVDHVKKDIDYLQKDLAKFERVRRFRLLSMPFSIENGELSPKLSIKRHVVERKYTDFIEQMYKM